MLKITNACHYHGVVYAATIHNLDMPVGFAPLCINYNSDTHSNYLILFPTKRATIVLHQAEPSILSRASGFNFSHGMNSRFSMKFADDLLSGLDREILN